MSKITYEDKQAIQNDESIPDKNKVTAKDMNEIKQVINQNAENLDELEKDNANNITLIEKLQKENNDQDKDIESNSRSIEEIKEEAEEIKAENVRLRSDINSIALIGEVEGESIDLDDSSEARFLEFGIGGNHKQEVREGYNLYNYKDVEAGKKLDGETGKIVSDPTFCFAGYIKVDENTEYVRSDVGTSTNAMLDENKQIIGKISGTSFTTPAGCKYVGFNIRKEKYADGSYLKFVMNKGTELKPFEEFGASPSPDYPSEIKVVGDNVQLFDESKAVTSTKNGMTLSYSASEGLILNGTTTAQTNFWINDLEINLKEIDYTLSSNLSLQNKGLYALKDPSGNDLVKNSLDEAVTFKSSETETVATQLLIQINAGVTFDKQSLKIKLEKGSIATSWSPFGQGCVKLNVANKNYFDPQNIDMDNQGIKMKGSKKNVEITATPNGTWGASNFIEVGFMSAGKYSIVFNRKNKAKGNYRIWIYDENSNDAIFNATSTFTLLKDYKKIRCKLVVEGLTVKEQFNDTLSVQIEKEKASDFIEHQSQQLIMPVQQEMLKGDYFDWENEKEVHTYKKWVLTGSEDWLKSSNTPNNIFYLDLPKSYSEQKALCNYFKYATPWNIDRVSFEIFPTNRIRFGVGLNSEIDTVDKWKEFLKTKSNAESPVIVFYKVSAPVELDFTSEQKKVAKQIKQTLHTYKNITHISSNDEVSPIFNVKYAKDPNLKNENLQKQIDEIKQLLSTTQTSAMLLDNFQNDIESEVI